MERILGIEEVKSFWVKKICLHANVEFNILWISTAKMKKWIYNRKRIQAHRKGRSVYVISVLHTTWYKLQNLITLLSKLFITVRQRGGEGYVVSPICLSVILSGDPFTGPRTCPTPNTLCRGSWPQPQPQPPDLFNLDLTLQGHLPPPPHTHSNLFTMKHGLSESRRLPFY